MVLRVRYKLYFFTTVQRFLHADCDLHEYDGQKCHMSV